MYLKYIVFFVFVIASLLLNAFMPTKIIDQIQMITVIGFDATEEERVQGTVASPKYQQEGQVEDFIYTDTADTVYEDWVKLNAKATERLLNGKIKVVFYNQKLAAEGISDFIGFLTRDPSIGGNVSLAVTEGSTLDVINSATTTKGRGIFFADLFEHNIRHGNLPQINLKIFESALDSGTQDPFLPMLSIEKERPALTAIAFFKGDQYVDKLPIEHADVFKMLYEKNVSDGEYQYKSEEYIAAVENIETTKDVVFETNGGSGTVTINVNIRGAVREFTGELPTTQKEKIERDIKQDIEKKANRLVSRFQELEIDPLGIEDDIKSGNRTYNQKHFKSAYPDMPIRVNAEVKITGYGIMR